MPNDNASNDPMDFIKNMWSHMGFTLPGMVTPSFDVEDIEKQVKDLKAVEGWLKMNLSMLQMTIQNLEMQCVTINTLRTMSKMATAQTQTSDTSPPAEGNPSASTQPEQAAMWPWNLMREMQDKMQQANTEPQTTKPEENPEAAQTTGKRRKKTQ